MLTRNSGNVYQIYDTITKNRYIKLPRSDCLQTFIIRGFRDQTGMLLFFELNQPYQPQDPMMLFVQCIVFIYLNFGNCKKVTMLFLPGFFLHASRNFGNGKKSKPVISTLFPLTFLKDLVYSIVNFNEFDCRISFNLLVRLVQT